MNDRKRNALLRYRPLEVHRAGARTIEFPFPGVVVLAHRIERSGTLELLRTEYAIEDAGSVATALLDERGAAGGADYFVYIKPVRNAVKARQIQSDFDSICTAVQHV
jgi:hypothetical protein